MVAALPYGKKDRFSGWRDENREAERRGSR